MKEPQTNREWQARWMRVRGHERLRVLRIEKWEALGYQIGARVRARPSIYPGMQDGTIVSTDLAAVHPTCRIRFDTGSERTFLIEHADIQLLQEATP